MKNLKPNILFQTDFLHPNQALELFLELKETVVWNKQMKSRYTASYGAAYHYSDISYERLPMPKPIKQLASEIAKIVGYMPNNCLLNYYLDGTSKMGFHSDDTSQLAKGTGVAIISLGEVRNMLFKHKQITNIITPYELTNGCLMHMNSDVQNDWLHSIPKSETQLGRISITFRKLNDK